MANTPASSTLTRLRWIGFAGVVIVLVFVVVACQTYGWTIMRETVVSGDVKYEFKYTFGIDAYMREYHATDLTTGETTSGYSGLYWFECEPWVPGVGYESNDACQEVHDLLWNLWSASQLESIALAAVYIAMRLFQCCRFPRVSFVLLIAVTGLLLALFITALCYVSEWPKLMDELLKLDEFANVHSNNLYYSWFLMFFGGLVALAASAVHGTEAWLIRRVCGGGGGDLDMAALKDQEDSQL